MAKKKTKKDLTDEQIRELVLSRLSTLSSDTVKSIGNEGTYTKDQLIEHVEAGDAIGKVIQNVEIEWLRALKEGIIADLYEPA